MQQQRLAALPAQVSDKIMEIKNTYGVFAASLAIDAMDSLIAHQNVTCDKVTLAREADAQAIPACNALRYGLRIGSSVGRRTA